jgi:hypothetical protein
LASEDDNDDTMQEDARNKDNKELNRNKEFIKCPKTLPQLVQ